MMYKLEWYADSDCASGLFCFERNGFENIPGCIGSGQQAFDYCFSPGSGFERLAFFGNLDYDYYELGQCEGGKIMTFDDNWYTLTLRSSHMFYPFFGPQIAILTVTARLGLFVTSEKGATMVAFQDVSVMPTWLDSEMMTFASHGQVPTPLSVFLRMKLAAIRLVEAFSRFQSVLEIAIVVSGASRDLILSVWTFF